MELEFSTEEYQKLPATKFFDRKTSFLIAYKCGKLKKMSDFGPSIYF